MYNTIIVDDELYAREFLENCLNDLCKDFKVVAKLSDGEEAIRYLENNKVEVVLTDVKMPKATGIDIAKFIYDNNLDIKVIIVSAYDDFTYAQQAIRYGVKNYILKVVDTEELVEVMNEIKLSLDNESKRIKSYDKVGREMFFYDLIFNMFDNEKQIINGYNDLDFEIPYKKAICDIIDINVEDFSHFINEQWRYDIDMFKEMFLNVIKLVGNTDFVMFSRFDDGSCTAIVLRNIDDEPYPNTSLEYEFYDIFGLRIKLSQTFTKTLFQLYSENNRHYFDEKEEDKLIATHNIVAEDELKSKSIEMAMLYINRYYAQNITRSEISDYVHLNDDYFGRVFKEHIGKTVSEYLLDVRMQKAIEMLNNGEKAEKICVAVGYKDIRSFRRAFHKYTGSTVSDFRKNV